MITNINSSGRYITCYKYQEQHGESVNLGLSPEADIILEWASKQMKEEQRRAELAQTNATVADAVESVRKAEEQLRVVMELVK